jgi:GNAT superfamily N-acetyltransferase
LSLAGQIGEVYRWQGAAGLAVRLLARVGGRVLHWYRLPDLRSAGNLTAAVPIRIEELGVSDSSGYLAFRRGATLEQYRARFETGYRCYVAHVDGKGIVSATWVATDRAWLHEFRKYLPLPADAIYVFDSYTLPEYRGKRISGALFAQISQIYCAAGFCQALTLTGPENAANIRSRTRSGFEPNGGIAQVGIGPLRKCITWGARQRVAI